MQSLGAKKKKNEKKAESSSTKKTATPSFTDLIHYQRSDGPWTKNARPVLEQFIAGANLQDETIETLIKQALSEGSQADSEDLYLTIVALFVLKEVFADKKEEWQLLAQKAKEFLKAAGVKNVDKHLKKIQLEVVQS